jgi:hypothetical protein
VDILGKKSAQVALVGQEDMIEQFAVTASHLQFGNTVLPRTATGRGQRFHPHVADRGRHFQSVFRIAIVSNQNQGYPRRVASRILVGRKGCVRTDDLFAQHRRVMSLAGLFCPRCESQPEGRSCLHEFLIRRRPSTTELCWGPWFI